MPSLRYEELTWPQARQAASQGRVLVLPVGTTEQHGPHLPLNVDCLTSTELARMGVERAPEDALLMPAISYSFNEHHLDFPGTIAVSWQSIIGYLQDVGRSAAHHGFRKIVLFNGHGSNVPFLDIAARLITNHSEAIACLVSWWSLAEPALSEVRASAFPGGMAHACEVETSLMLHLRPDLVDMSLAVKDISFQPSEFIFWDLQRSSPVTFQEHFSRYSKTGIVGDPTVATAEKGARVAECVADNFARFLREFRRREIGARVNHHA